MAKEVLLDVEIEVNGQDISNWCRSVTVHTEDEEVDVTGFQASAREILKGLKDADIELEVFLDYSAGSIDALFWPLSQTKTPFPVKVRPKSTAIAADNPSYEMSALLFGYDPIAGSVGEAATTTIPLRNAAAAGLTKDITP